MENNQYELGLWLGAVFGPLLIIGFFWAGFKTFKGEEVGSITMPPIFGLVQWGAGLAIGVYFIPLYIRMGAYNQLALAFFVTLVATLGVYFFLKWYRKISANNPELKDAISTICTILVSIPLPSLFYLNFHKDRTKDGSINFPDYMEPIIFVPFLAIISCAIGIFLIRLVLKYYRSKKNTE